MTEAAIVGWAHSPFGKLEDPIRSLIGRVAGAAIEDAGISPTESTRLRQPFQRRLLETGFSVVAGVAACAGTAFRPITRYENACASGSAAVHGARDLSPLGAAGSRW